MTDPLAAPQQNSESAGPATVVASTAPAVPLALVWRGAPLAVVVVRADGVVTHANPAAQRLLVENLAGLVGHDWWELLAARGASSEALGALRCAKPGDAAVELPMAAHGGSNLWVAWTRAEGQGEPAADPVVYFGQDVQRQVEAVAGLKQVRDAAQASSRVKSDFLANMSHEIRTPMTAILGYADLLVNEEGLDRAPPHRREALQAMQRNCEHLLTVVNDILDLSKIEAGRLEISPVTCSPAQIVHDVQLRFQVRAQAKGLTLHVDCSLALTRLVKTDPTRLRQILFNLVGNAIKFTHHGGVAVRLRETAGLPGQVRLQFDVQDTGIGMAPEAVERLFRPYSQADSSTSRRYGGTGLGLAISKHLANLLGGDITVASRPDHGSTFTVTVLADQAEESIAQPHTKAAPAVSFPLECDAADATGPPLAGLRLLLAEDGPDNQRLITYILTKAGAQVTLAENGREAVDAILGPGRSAGPFDVVLMDMQMPILDGYTATGQLRGAGYAQPIIALTAHSMASDRNRCLEAGCDDYFTKPIDRHKLIALVAEHAAKAAR